MCWSEKISAWDQIGLNLGGSVEDEKHTRKDSHHEEVLHDFDHALCTHYI